MKKIIIIIFVILPFLNIGYPQFYYNPTYILRAMNFSLNSPKNNFFEFDIYIQHTNPETLFEYAGGMYFFSFNPFVALNIGELKCSLLDSDLPAAMRPRITNTQGGPIHTVQNPKDYSIRLAINTFPGTGGGFIIPNNGYPGTKITRVRIERISGSFKNFHFNLAWRNPPIITFSTKIYAYVGTANTDITTPSTHIIDSSGITSFTNLISENGLSIFPLINSYEKFDSKNNVLLDSYSGNSGNISFDNNQSDYIKLYESFSFPEFPPPGWRTIVKDTGMGSWYRTNYNYRTGGGGVESDYSPNTGCNYLISKRFIPAVDDSLTFYLSQFFTNVYNDSLEIFISNRDSLLNSFTTRLMILRDGAEYPPAGTWGRFSFYLGDYSGQTVWLAFRHSDNNGENIRIDDIQVGRLAAQQISIYNKFPFDTTCTDNPLVPYAIFTNIGSENIQSVSVNYTIGNKINYTSTKVINLLNVGQSLTVYFDTLTFTDTGSYTGIITSSIPNQRHEQYSFYVSARNWGYGGRDIWWANSEPGGYYFPWRKPKFSWRDTTGSVSLFVNGILVSGLYVGTSYAGELRDGYFNLGNLLVQNSGNKCIRLNGVSYNGIYPTIDGAIGLTNNNTPPLNIASSDIGYDNCPSPAIYVLWMNMYFKPQSENRFSYKINIDTTELIITWDKASVYSDSKFISFQASIELVDANAADTRNSNIRFNYADTTFSRTSLNLLNSYSNFGFGFYTSNNRHIVGINPNQSSSLVYYRYRFGDYSHPNEFIKWKNGPLYEAPLKKSLSVEFGSDPAQLTKFDNKFLNVKFLTEGLQKNINPRSRDTFLVVLRKAVSPYDPVSFLKIKTDTSGVKNISVSGVTAGRSYYVSVEHRNSIRTWSSLPLLFGNDIDTVIYDFTSDVTQSYGNNMTVVNGNACLYSGDINQDRVIDGEDKALIDNDIFLFAAGSYVNTDLNWDGIVDGIDALICDNNASGYIQEIYPQ